VTFFLANPAGLWALIGLPIVLLIHLLQRNARRLPASTLFLLDRLAPESVTGRRLDWIRNSIPLWLQLLGVLLLTFLLIEPRWVNRTAVQRIAVVLDSSASMSAFRARVEREVPQRMRDAIAARGARTEWLVLGSDPRAGALYHGENVEAAIAAFGRWKTDAGTHDWSTAFRTASRFIAGGGWMLVVSDRQLEVPPAAELLALGEPIGNCGWLGLDFQRDTKIVRALAKNHGASVQRRRWSFEAGGVRREGEITIEPQTAAVIEVEWPENATSAEFRLEPDGFGFDDRMPVVLPERKRLTVHVTGGDEQIWNRILSAEPGLDRVESNGDVQFTAVGAAEPAGNAIVFGPGALPSAPFRTGAIVPERDPLTEGLSWQGLVAKAGAAIPVEPGDRVLVWEENIPLVFVRSRPGAQQLVFAFDVTGSNASRMPGFFLMVHRFLDQIRASKVAPETKNVELNQRLEIAFGPEPAPISMIRDGSAPELLTREAASLLRAPANPGFFEVRQGENALLRAAASFGDVREADFREATTIRSLPAQQDRFRNENSVQDFLSPILGIAFLAAMCGSWAAIARKSR
jgi:hypothetical protein